MCEWIADAIYVMVALMCPVPDRRIEVDLAAFAFAPDERTSVTIGTECLRRSKAIVGGPAQAWLLMRAARALARDTAAGALAHLGRGVPASWQLLTTPWQLRGPKSWVVL